jgi:EAL domain-containing protein (putative c-di-GMP-specific phosphodiesterase class I)/DNA-binding NarL/FixJ family response regulator
VRLLIADDEADVRDSLARIVGGDRTFNLVAAATTADEAIVLAGLLQPELALVGVNVGGGGVRAAVGIRTASPGTRVLALSAFSDPENVSQMLQAGALGYFVKGTSAADLLAGLHRAAEGEVTPVPDSRSQGHEPGTEDEVEERLRQRWIRRGEHIREAIDGHLLSRVFQPVFDLRGRRVVGAEALARFGQDSDGAPSTWFSDAADVDLLPELELEAISGAFSAVELLPRAAFVSVNLSPVTILTGAVEELISTDLHGRVVIEISERAPVRDYEALARAMNRLRVIGVRLAVDDFGSGTSGLRHVLKLEPDMVKLHIKLTRSIDQELGSQAIVAGLIAFAQRTGATVVATGIETEAELYTLRALGATLGQGYLLGRPMAPSALARFIQRTQVTSGGTRADGAPGGLSRSHTPPTTS